MNIRKLELKDVTIKVSTEKEYTSVESASKDCGENAEDFIKTVKELKKSSRWGWCTVRVDATYKGFKGSDYLGCCSYRSKEDFIAGGYYEQMVKAALDELNKVLSLKYDEIKDLVEA
jgi:hypothetical protein